MNAKFKVTRGLKYPVGKQYCNGDSFYSLSIEGDTENPMDFIDKNRTKIEEYFYEKLQEDAERYKDFLKERESVQRVSTINNKRYPHVTNIITPDMPPIPHIMEHAYYGTKLDEAMKQYIDKGITAVDWDEQKNVKLNLDDMVAGAIRQIESNKLELSRHSVKCLNEDFIYCGELDATGSLGGASVVIDFKKTKNVSKALKEKYFMQIAAYAACSETLVDAMVIVTPYDIFVEGDTIGYFQKFLLCRGAYKERFGI